MIWSMLAGVSLAMTGCGEPVYGVPADVQAELDVEGDAGDSSDDAVEDAQSEEDEDLNVFMYGPQPAYGPP